jgi:hypothetical protein
MDPKRLLIRLYAQVKRLLGLFYPVPSRLPEYH